MRINLKIVFLLLISFHICACTSENKANNETSSIEHHPVEDRIPYFDRNHIRIKESSSANLFETFNYSSIRNYYQYFSSDLGYHLEGYLSDPLETEIISLHNERIILLDKKSSLLAEYNLNTDDQFTLATFGRGPGDIAYTSDIVSYNELIFIVMQDMRISIFNCSVSPCAYEETIMLDRISPMSITLIKESNKIAIFGSIPISYPTDAIIHESVSHGAITIIDSNHNIISNFGETYDYKADWLLMLPFNQGIVRYNGAENQLISSFKRFPFVYVYDASNYNLIKSFNIKSFMQGKQLYDRDAKFLQVIRESFSEIKQIKIFDNSVVIIEIINRYYQERKDYRNRWKTTFDYYLIELSTDKHTHLLETYNDRRLFPAQHGYMAYINDNYYWFSYE